MRGKNAASRRFVFLLERDGVTETDLSFGSLPVRLGHDRQLDQAGRLHRLIRLVIERFILRQMLDRDGDFTLMGSYQRSKALAERLGREPSWRQGARYNNADNQSAMHDSL